jgi:hypothetical protein
MPAAPEASAAASSGLVNHNDQMVVVSNQVGMPCGIPVGLPFPPAQLTPSAPNCIVPGQLRFGGRAWWMNERIQN